MESFFRIISYVDYFSEGDKIRNVGFLRWKLSSQEHNIEIQIKDISAANGNFNIWEKNTKKKIGEIKIDKGIGSFVHQFPAMSAAGEMYLDTLDGRLYLSDVKGFCILLNEKEYLQTLVTMKQEEKKIHFIEHEKKESEEQRQTAPEEKPEELPLANEVKTASENILIDGIEEKYENPVEETKIELIEPIHEDKWQQLCRKYPKVHPFKEKQTFLSVKLEDFIILQQGYQKLAQNSFLLHGFYNYGHMILGKLSEHEEAPIYIGVPGVYYEREKQAAQMFGFIGFESTEQPVQAGSYGYYMIEVKI